MTNKPAKHERPAGELNPTALVEQKQFDSVCTHACPRCGKVFAVENLMCPNCSSIVKGKEVSAWSNFSYDKTAQPVPLPREMASTAIFAKPEKSGPGQTPILDFDAKMNEQLPVMTGAALLIAVIVVLKSSLLNGLLAFVAISFCYATLVGCVKLLKMLEAH